MVKIGVLQGVVHCGLGGRDEDACQLDGVKPHDHEINPRAEAHKASEMTVLRALQLIDAFDALEPGQDWTDVPGATYRKIIGDRYEYGTLLSECFERWKRGTLHREVMDLAANLPPSALKRKEIHVGLKAIEARLGRKVLGKGRRSA